MLKHKFRIILDFPKKMNIIMEQLKYNKWDCNVTNDKKKIFPYKRKPTQ